MCVDGGRGFAMADGEGDLAGVCSFFFFSRDVSGTQDGERIGQAAAGLDG